VSVLKKRIAHQAMGKTAAPLTEVALPPGTPEFAPSSQIIVWAPGTVGIGPLAPLLTADGALVPATAPGTWDQLVAAGRSKG
jgi:hypothetical protein